MKKRVQDFGLTFGRLERGPFNSITDVPDVRVGHTTIIKDDPVIARTGVTAIIPADGDLFDAPVFAASHIANGFGKTIGLPQVKELGHLETPIVLTNTLNVGIAADALVSYGLSQNKTCRSLNPVVGECNDYKLNDIRVRSVTPEDVLKALDSARSGPIRTGSIGAGTGMVCFGYKGGVGTASRTIPLGNRNYTLGTLVVSNFGRITDLMIQGQSIPPCFEKQDNGKDQGSIMVIIGTDLPLSERQLKRVAARAVFGIARTGGRCGHGSGEIIIAFSTANRIQKSKAGPFREATFLTDTKENTQLVFDAAIDSTEEAIIASLFTAETIKGINGRTVQALPVDRLFKEGHIK